MSLAFAFTHRLTAFTLDVAWAGSARTLGITGASGSGKTTLLNLLAGTLRPQQGRLQLGERRLVDTEQGIVTPPQGRRFGYVFQDGRLFPHLTVRQNLWYGRWFTRRRALPVEPERIIAMLGIGPLLHRRAVGLSGGEQQRVAIGRALFTAPDLLLMDEPLAALDDERRAEVLDLIEHVRDELRIPLVYVSHNQPEIERLADAILVLDRGRTAAPAASGASARQPCVAPN